MEKIFVFLSRFIFVLIGIILGICGCASSQDKIVQDNIKGAHDNVDLLSRIPYLEKHQAGPDVYRSVIGSNDPAVRARTALSLARLHHESTLPVLVVMLQDSSEKVRNASAFGIARLLKSSRIDSKAHRHLRAVGVDALLKALLVEKDAKVRSLIFQGLAASYAFNAQKMVIKHAGKGDKDALRAMVAFPIVNASVDEMFRKKTLELALGNSDARYWALRLLRQFRAPLNSEDLHLLVAENKLSVEEKVALLEWVGAALEKADLSVFSLWLKAPEARVRRAAFAAFLKALKADLDVDTKDFEKAFQKTASEFVSGDAAFGPSLATACSILISALPNRAEFMLERVLSATVKLAGEEQAVTCACAAQWSRLSSRGGAMNVCFEVAEPYQSSYFQAVALGYSTLPDEFLAKHWGALLNSKSPEQQALLLEQVSSSFMGSQMRKMLKGLLNNAVDPALISSTLRLISQAKKTDGSHFYLGSLLQRMPLAESSGPAFAAWEALALSLDLLASHEKDILKQNIIVKAPLVARRFQGRAFFERNLPVLNMEEIWEEEQRKVELEQGIYHVPQLVEVKTTVGSLRFKLREKRVARTLYQLQKHYGAQKELQLVRTENHVVYFHQASHGLGGELWQNLDESTGESLERGALVLTSFASHKHSSGLAVIVEPVASQLTASTVIGVIENDVNLDFLFEGILARKARFSTSQ